MDSIFVPAPAGAMRDVAAGGAAAAIVLKYPEHLHTARRLGDGTRPSWQDETRAMALTLQPRRLGRTDHCRE